MGSVGVSFFFFLLLVFLAFWCLSLMDGTYEVKIVACVWRGKRAEIHTLHTLHTFLASLPAHIMEQSMRGRRLFYFTNYLPTYTTFNTTS